MALGRIVLTSATAAVLAFACSSDNSSNESPEGGLDSGTPSTGGKSGTGGASTGGKSSGGSSSGGAAGSTSSTGGKHTAEAGVPDSGDAGPVAPSLCGGMTGDDLIKCGQYMVQSLDACGDCHTPRLPSGAPDTTKILAGSPSFTDLTTDPNDGMGNIPAPNLTTLSKDKWTSAEIVDAIQNGKVSKAHGGKGLFPAMPYVTFHNMALVDAQAIAAYLLSLTPITNDIPAREPLPGIPDAAFPVAYVNPGDIPDPVIDKSDPSYADAMFGKYLAAEAGPCLDCHTERFPDGTVNMAHPFAGGQPFVIGGPFGTVISANITPDSKTGLKNWTPGAIEKLLHAGIDIQNEPICPPMPVGPNGAFAGITNAHALAIGAYITHLPPVSNGDDAGGPFPLCRPPAPPTDGGKSDSGI
jgi:mono/diheme cytochrome c family protein